MASMRIISHDLDFAAVRAEFDLPALHAPDFPEEVLAEARESVDAHADTRTDRTELDLVTIDPPGAMDLDQAVLIDTRDGGGWIVWYAIADVGALVRPGGMVEAASLQRGQTLYLPDGSVPLHPRELSEAAGSLLPDQERAAVLWRIELDGAAQVVAIDLERARVRSRQRFTYAEVQRASEQLTLHPSLVELPSVGRALRKAGIAAGAVNLRLPAQDVAQDEKGHWVLRIEPRTEADEWNAQISLLVGRCAAQIMLDGGAGLLRTLPPAQTETIADLRATAAALHLDWPEEVSLGVFLDGLDINAPKGMAMMRASTAALRGAGYAAFRGRAPEVQVHTGIGGPYAHVTAPLRRLGDRFATEICLALRAGTEIPQWVLAHLDALPESLQSAGKKASSIDRACVDLAEAVVLAEHVGEQFAVYVLRDAPAPDPQPADGKDGNGGKNGKQPKAARGEVFLAQPPVFGPCTGPIVQGVKTPVRLATADPDKRRILFTAQG